MAGDLIQIAPPNRRTFLKTLGAAGAAASVTACAVRPPERILPLLAPDPRAIPGKPQMFASTCRECPAGCGMVVRVNTGRPSKCEGNPDHPVNRGKLCLRGQTAVEGLYNPDRFRQPMLRDAHGQLRPTDWPTALARFDAELAKVQAEGRGGDIVWLGQLESGTLDGIIRGWLKRQGALGPLYYEYLCPDALRAAMAISYGKPVIPRYHLERARCLVSFGAEFLETWLSNVEFAGDFAAMHSFGHTPTPAHFTAVGPRLSLTAANADQWWPAQPGSEPILAWALAGEVARRLGKPLQGPQVSLPAAAHQSRVDAGLIAEAALRLVDAHPSLVLGTGYQTDNRGAVSTWLAVNALNDLLGNTGTTVIPDEPHALTLCATQKQVLDVFAPGNRTRLLLLHHANPAFHHPVILSGLYQVPFKVSFASWRDETTKFADLVLPDHHFLEAWGDYAPRGDVAGMIQPQRIPLYETRQTGDVLLGGEGKTHAAIEAAWAGKPGALTWDARLRKGVSEPAAAAVSYQPSAIRHPPAGAELAARTEFDGTGEFYLVVFPSVQFYDGRQANRQWAQEIAEPMSKIAWDPWCELHPKTAARLGFKPNDVVRIVSPHGAANFSLYVTTWIREDCVGVMLGQGHTDFGMFANGAGESPHPLQGADSTDGVWAPQTVKVTLEHTGRTRALANLQPERNQFDKNIALAVTVAEAESAAARETVGPDSFYHFHHPYLNHRWGMTIDLSSCIGCNACQAACYAENNIAVWGRSGCQSHREMTWIRVEQYEGEQAHPATEINPDIRFIPMPCMQCGNAPCEYVCPVFAAYHTDEGLNGQAYNRCVGTRYCSNNCIYKVRRFNWFTPQWSEPLNQQLNPLVTVRAKGVMEKCTFCVQRIQLVELDARTNHTAIRDGDIQTACQQTCPTNAIVFGDLLDPASRVSQLTALNRSYGMFAEENTYPAVHYQKKTKFVLNAPGGQKPYGDGPS
ncbi:MAG: 4Fe-4S dicluster domain-containing protein [Acidobacteria bacterium]|nr:MAG: 4Fe-4S dicluster domain-containing protein [Acidobacteriota bacterium]